MYNKERSAVLVLALIMAFRMLGLFMILPVFSSNAHHFIGANATLIGVALGIYGLTQATLQIPFGMLSDKVGRKPVILLGLILFAAGSVVAALSHHIYLIIFGRALQGAGAIGSTALAMVADLTRDENRSKAMATMGLTIGFAFAVAMVLGPIINAWFQLAGIFWFTALLSICGMLLLFVFVPTPPNIVSRSVGTTMDQLKSILKNSQLFKLDLGIFILHAMLTAIFIVIPIILSHTVKFSESQQAVLYLSVLFFAFMIIFPLIIVAEKKRLMKQIFICSVGALTVSQILLLFSYHSALGIMFNLVLFFAAFTLLEAILPSLISKLAPIRNKGAAMGVYSSSQF